MEMTKESLITIYKRLQEVFLAKTGEELDTIELYDDGDFCCSYTYGRFGDTETISEHITITDLTSDLDELVKIREEKEDLKRKEQEKRQIANDARYKKEQKAKRLAEYEKLKKEFES